jgi:ABC-2 type transport system ATP-binding protein
VGVPALELKGVSHRFGVRPVLDRVSFRIEPGEHVGYLGPNGAGKTTTFRLLAGLLSPAEGRVALLGADPADPTGVSRRRLGALVESPSLPSYVRGRDLLGYIARARGTPRREVDGAVERAARLTGVERRLSPPFGTLSTGLQRRVLLAAALLGEPAVLLLDEPTAGLDPVARQDLRTLVRELPARETTVLLSSHLLEDVEQTCTRVLFLRDGRLVGDEPVRAEEGGTAETRPAAIRLRFLTVPPPELLRTVLRPEETVLETHGRELSLRVPDGESGQASLLQRLVGAGLRPVGLERVRPGLEERYLAAIGREDEP